MLLRQEFHAARRMLGDDRGHGGICGAGDHQQAAGSEHRHPHHVSSRHARRRGRRGGSKGPKGTLKSSSCFQVAGLPRAERPESASVASQMGRTIATMSVELRRKLTGGLQPARCSVSPSTAELRNASPHARLHQQALSPSNTCMCCSAGELVASGTHSKFLSAADALVNKSPPPEPRSKL